MQTARRARQRGGETTIFLSPIPAPPADGANPVENAPRTPGVYQNRHAPAGGAEPAGFALRTPGVYQNRHAPVGGAEPAGNALPRQNLRPKHGLGGGHACENRRVGTGERACENRRVGTGNALAKTTMSERGVFIRRLTAAAVCAAAAALIFYPRHGII